MTMLSQCEGFSDDINGYQFVDGTMSPDSNETSNYSSLFEYRDPLVDLNFANSPSPQHLESILNVTSISGTSSDVQSPDDGDSDPVLKYISQMLMEEDMAEKSFHDPLALQAAEKPFYEVLGQKYPPSDLSPIINHHVERPDDDFLGSTGELSGNSNSTTSTNNLVNFIWTRNLSENESSLIRTPLVEYSTQKSTVSQGTIDSFSSLADSRNGLISTSLCMPMDLNSFDQRESMKEFQRGFEEASKFLPKSSDLSIDLEDITFPDESKEVPAVVVKMEREDSADGLRGRKVHNLEDGDYEDGRSSKQSAVFVEDDELSEMFDKVLLWASGTCEKAEEKSLKLNGMGLSFEQNNQLQGFNGGTGRSRKQGIEKNPVDLTTLLILCAQAIASDDRRMANELLKLIRRHSTPLGDGSQRLAHYFANALEARLAGTGSHIYTTLAPKRTTAAEVIKAYQVFISASPFKKISVNFSVSMIFKAAEKATKLHVIDFGILYGFQWPILIKMLSQRPGGPPKLCITGIDFPFPGFRPAERVEATGRRLAKYCKRFNVPFEYHAVAQKWETIKAEDIKISGDEFVAVNCMHRFRNLLDESVVVDSPRNAVLNLIRKINPDIFIHVIRNGSLNTPFFVTRFREALFHFLTLFDMFDANITREQPDRLMYEEFYGREIMNVVACEGTERVARPETYKQWQVRNMKAGFRQLPLDQELMEKLRSKIMTHYHKDFLIDVYGHWALQGWRGRITFAMSAWVPS
ncbi:hypothetical protein Nepgr_014107 [Nepenthes gracilis]|uniref:Uncharacterized protein n=1 Tax=Nepenthes gracilis TaxID=150966 RepID=A0AAD3SKW7_NEPGR|nr:hypothetical protein Nepgr_014107 [Nepenthes gracilis]